MQRKDEGHSGFYKLLIRADFKAVSGQCCQRNAITIDSISCSCARSRKILDSFHAFIRDSRQFGPFVRYSGS